MAQPRLIVCEQRAQWAVALRGALAKADTRVWEVRSAAECFGMLHESPASVVAWEGTRDNRRSLADMLILQSQTFPQARSLVVSTRDLRRWAWYWREAGAIHVVWSPRMLDQIVRIVLRHLTAAAEPPLAVDAMLWAELPWPENASAGEPPADP